MITDDPEKAYVVCVTQTQGAALMSGMMLRPLFRGTGYSEAQRTQGDFGSDIFIAEEAE